MELYLKYDKVSSSDDAFEVWLLFPSLKCLLCLIGMERQAKGHSL